MTSPTPPTEINLPRSVFPDFHAVGHDIVPPLVGFIVWGYLSLTWFQNFRTKSGRSRIQHDIGSGQTRSIRWLSYHNPPRSS